MNNRIYILDSSRDVTGALKSSLLVAKSLENIYDINFILPVGSKADKKVLESGYDLVLMGVPSLRKKLKSIILYCPILIKFTVELKKVIEINNCSILILNDFDKPVGLLLNILGWKGKIYTFVRRRPSSFNKVLASIWIKNAIYTSENVIAVSDVVLKELPISKKVVRIYNPVDMPSYYECTDYPSFDIIKFLCLGNYMPGKGQDEALNAFLSAYESNKNIRLHFVGGDLGLKKNAYYKRYLVNKVERLGLANIITFHGYVDNIEDVISESHVVLNFSISESFSRVCVEAASYGRPVIATKSGGPQEIILHGESGFLVDIGDIDSMSKYIIWFSNNSEKIPLMGKIATEIVSNKFSLEKFQTEMKELFFK